MRQSATRRENTFRQVKGNLRFPLTATYHGCHPPSKMRRRGYNEPSPANFDIPGEG
jgi:hypothetical protein